ncbi:MAG: Arc family DNA-binding protein [Chloroflexota bacterium]
MTVQTITLRLPNQLYQQVKQRAQARQRSVEDELVAVVAASLPDQEELPGDLAAELEQLSLLTDDELWQTARTTMKPAEIKRMQALSTRQRGKGLTAAEQREVEELLYRYDWITLVRAKAAVSLKERGYDIFG